MRFTGRSSFILWYYGSYAQVPGREEHDDLVRNDTEAAIVQELCAHLVQRGISSLIAEGVVYVFKHFLNLRNACFAPRHLFALITADQARESASFRPIHTS